MKTYARIVNTVVVEIILPAINDSGTEIAIEERFHPDLVAELKDITKVSPMPAEGWVFKNNKYMTPVAVITVDDQLKLNERAIQQALDAKAAERGYSSIKSACAYASSTIISGTSPVEILREKFRQEGNALQHWLGEVWATAYIHQAAVLAGTEECPSEEEAVSLMPVFVWPSA